MILPITRQKNVFGGPPAMLASLAFCERYRCPDQFFRLKVAGSLPEKPTYFSIDSGITGYGRNVAGLSGREPEQSRSIDGNGSGGNGALPFDLTEVVDNLRLERYPEALVRPGNGSRAKVVLRNGYYCVRPFLPVAVRRQFQRLYLRDWDKRPFPKWPVDCSVEEIFEHVLRLLLKSGSTAEIPFVWFWPHGYQGCVILTHDVETESGRDFCSELMDVDEGFGFKSSFQIVPEKRYTVSPDFLSEIVDRGFEVNVHGLNHEGDLFDDYDEFVRCAALINEYGRRYNALGFRSPVLYRNAAWLDALNFMYDMSFPNVAHLDPQRGGCCTVMPYFIGNLVELPLTTIQDYSLFNIVGDFSIDLWKRQIETIIEKHGLVTLLVHPDYIIGKRQRSIYEQLLAHVAKIARDRNLWVALPKDVAAWWKCRAQSKVVRNGGQWRIEGPAEEAAMLAYASAPQGRISYRVEAS